ncbi:bifunctional apoptosis regulator [Brachionus plicatilis]|uniref:Bifunctional apoptosis regulator n=1 Tax=Brachionus plicatilis TaxID=10195 RepID=A0A3M7P636_BRAPC|nr:bifunctional apoptosis regulator [Brachionus plicatilis]
MVRIRLFDKLLKSSSLTKIKKLETSTSSSEENFLEINNESTLFNLINDNFSCNCCFEILRNPVTLTCGHSFCQLCIANWYLASESSKCPTCRQEWSKIPQINCILKSTIKTVVTHELIQPNVDQDIKILNEYLKKCDNLNQEEIKKIKEYETKFKLKANISTHSTNTTNSPAQMTNRLTLNDVRAFTRRTLNYGFYLALGFILGILFGFIMFSLLWLISSALFTKYSTRDTIYESFIKIRKKYALKTDEWTSSDVQEWLTQLGPWTGDIMHSAKNANLDGQGLLLLNHKVLVEHPYEINDEQIRNLLLDSIKILDRCRFEVIDFWQLKNANKFQILWNSFVFESFPRVLILYKYFYSEISYNIFERYALKKIENVGVFKK